jgi:hypothetical protein
MIFFGALGVIMSRLSDKPAASHPAPAPAVIQPTPAATPSGVVPLPAPRVRLVRLPAPAPRARLVRLPDFTEIAAAHIDETHTIQMPYGMEVRATLRGFLGTEDQLPRIGLFRRTIFAEVFSL